MKKIISKIWISASPMAVFLVLVISVIPLSAFEAHVVNVTAKIERRPCVQFETRSYGFWKTHPEVRIFPQTLGAEIIADNEAADAIFGLSNNIMLNKLKKQLLTLKFNVSFYNSGTALVPDENITVNALIAEADAMITANPPASKDELEAMKNRLESANVDGMLSTCPTKHGGDDDDGGDDEEHGDDENNEHEHEDDDNHDNNHDEEDKDKDKNKQPPLNLTATSTAEISATTTATTTEAVEIETVETIETEEATTTPESVEIEAEETAVVETEETTVEPEQSMEEDSTPVDAPEETEPVLIIN